MLTHLEARLRTSTYDDRTGNGLLVRGRPLVQRLGAALNTSFVTIDNAVAAGVDLLLVHHPSWPSIDLHLHPPKLDRLHATQLSLYAAHEALDRAPTDSVGALLARRIDLTLEREGGDDLVIGIAPSLTFEVWTALVADRLGTPIRAWPNNPHFRRVAVVPGGGGSTDYVARAIGLGCDTFLTGEGSLYTELFARECGVSLVLASHSATELSAVCALAASTAHELVLDWVPIEGDTHITGGGRAPIEHSPRAG
ncbi:MAG: Nif3-like dinuclear metal center hexameric protein [Gemmatimonadota bacterium]